MHRLDEKAPVVPLTAGSIVPLIKAAVLEFMEDRAMRLAAALSYYALFSVTPLLLISIALAGVIFGDEAARGQILETLSGVIGESAGKAMQELILHARQQERSGTAAAILGFALILFGAAGAFNQLKDSLNIIMEVPPAKGLNLWRFLRHRLLSVAMVGVVGFLLLASLIVSAGLAAGGKYLEGVLPGTATIWLIVNGVVAFLVVAVLFALIFRFVPDRRPTWSDVWPGALFTSALFTVGKVLIGMYLGRGSIATAYGAAGSVVVLLIWIYYSANIVFFGAEFTEVYARRKRTGSTEPRTRTVHAEKPPSRVLPAAPMAARSRGGSAVAPVMTGCAGLLVGLLIGIVSAIVGVVVTTLRSLMKKITG